MSWIEVEYATAGNVATITLNRPDRLNAWTATMARELREVVEQPEADPGVRAIVLTGAGRGFCAGADTSVLQQRAAETVPVPAPAD